MGLLGEFYGRKRQTGWSGNRASAESGGASRQETRCRATRRQGCCGRGGHPLLLEAKGNIGRILILYESLDGKRLGSVDSGLTAEQVLMMIELYKQWLLHGQYEHPSGR